MNDFTLKVKSKKIKSMPITKHGLQVSIRKKENTSKQRKLYCKKKKSVNFKSAKFKLKKGYDNKF